VWSVRDASLYGGDAFRQVAVSSEMQLRLSHEYMDMPSPFYLEFSDVIS